MDGVKRVSVKRVTTHHASSIDHRIVQKSSTLNRKFVKKPAARPKISNVSISKKNVATARISTQAQGQRVLTKQNSVRLQPIAKKQEKASTRISINELNAEKVDVKRAQVQPQKSGTAQAAQRIVAQRKNGAVAQKEVLVQPEVAKIARARMMARQAPAPEAMTAREIKDRAIQQALKKMSKVDARPEYDEIQPVKRHFWQKKQFVIFATAAVAVVALLGYMAYVNLPDLSARVAAMQSGIEKVYPGFVPNTYRLDGLVKEDAGRITMAFKNNDGKTFTLREEKSSWDSNAVLSNYVKREWDDYSITKGQGLTIYVSGSNAAWVNGGVFYVINDASGTLTVDDLHDIAVSL